MTHTSTTSVACLVQGEEPGLLAEMEEGRGRGILAHWEVGKKAFLILKV